MLTKESYRSRFAKRIIISIFFIIAAFGAASIVGNRIQTLAASISQSRAISHALANRSEYISQIEKDFLLIGNSDTKISQAYITVDSLDQFISATESLSNQQGLVQTIKFGASIPYTTTQMQQFPISSVDYTIALTGNVVTLSGYLKKFEKLPFFAGIKGVSLTSNTSQGWENNSTITLQGNIYVRSETK